MGALPSLRMGALPSLEPNWFGTGKALVGKVEPNCELSTDDPNHADRSHSHSGPNHFGSHAHKLVSPTSSVLAMASDVFLGRDGSSADSELPCRRIMPGTISYNAAARASDKNDAACTSASFALSAERTRLHAVLLAPLPPPPRRNSVRWHDICDEAPHQSIAEYDND